MVMLASRSDAGRQLAGLLANQPGAAVLAIPPGGVAVAVQIAYWLHAYLEVVPAVEPLAGRPAIVVDDGTASIASLVAAIALARSRGAGHVTLAVPIAQIADVRALYAAADAIVCLVYIGFGTAPADCYRNDDAQDAADVHVLLRRAVEAGVATHGTTAAT